MGDLEEQVADSLEEYRPERHDELQPGGADAEPHFQRGLTYLMAVRKPVIAAINGPCAGMGLAMAAASDVRFAGEDAFFVSAFAQRGLVAEHATSWILPRLLGPARALDLLWTGRRVSAEEALQIGLVNRVVAIEDLVPTAQSYVRDLARTTSRRSLMHVKQQVYQDLMRPLGPGHDRYGGAHGRELHLVRTMRRASPRSPSAASRTSRGSNSTDGAAGASVLGRSAAADRLTRVAGHS